MGVHSVHVLVHVCSSLLSTNTNTSIYPFDTLNRHSACICDTNTSWFISNHTNTYFPLCSYYLKYLVELGLQKPQNKRVHTHVLYQRRPNKRRRKNDMKTTAAAAHQYQHYVFNKCVFFPSRLVTHTLSTSFSIIAMNETMQWIKWVYSTSSA